MTAARTRLEVVPLEPTIGSEVRGIDLHQHLDDATIGELRSAALERKVLVLREQHPTPDELVRFTRCFGEPFRRDDGYAGPATFGGNPHVGQVGPSAPGRRPGGDWHLGGTWSETPLTFEILTMAVVPPVGGSTLFADLQAAYADLSGPMQRMLCELRAAHSTQVTPSGRRHDRLDTFDPDHHVTHPLVVTHPETGVAGLYLTSRITHLLDVPKHESAALLAFLRAHASAPQYQYRQRWTAGDVVLWDNRSTWHFAVDDYGDAERWGFKTGVVGHWRPT